MAYKISYIITLVMLVTLVLVSYVLILKEGLKSRVVRPDENSAQARSMSIKICFIIGSQLIAWVSYILAAIYFSWIEKTGVSGSFVELFALVILPSNSLLNPIFYSDDYKKIEQSLKIIIETVNWIKTVKWIKSNDINKRDCEGMPTEVGISMAQGKSSTEVVIDPGNGIVEFKSNILHT